MTIYYCFGGTIRCEPCTRTCKYYGKIVTVLNTVSRETYSKVNGNHQVYGTSTFDVVNECKTGITSVLGDKDLLKVYILSSQP